AAKILRRLFRSEINLSTAAAPATADLSRSWSDSMATIWFDSSVIGLPATHHTQPSFRLKVTKVWLSWPFFAATVCKWARQIMRQLRLLAMRGRMDLR